MSIRNSDLSVKSYSPRNTSLYVASVAVRHTADKTVLLVGWYNGEDSSVLIRERFVVRGHMSLESAVKRIDAMLEAGHKRYDDDWEQPVYTYTVVRKGNWLVWQH